MSIPIFFLVLGLIFWTICAIVKFAIIRKLERKRYEIEFCDIDNYGVDRMRELTKISTEINTLDNVAGWCFVIGFISISIGSSWNYEY